VKRFNLLDYIIVFGLLIIIIPFIHAYMRFNEKGVQEEMKLKEYSEYVNIIANNENYISTLELDVSFKNLNEKGVSEIVVGDREEYGGIVLMEILSVGEPTRNYFLVGQGDQEVCVAWAENLALPARVRVRGFVCKNSFFYKKEGVFIGRAFLFKDKLFIVEGFVKEGK